LSDKLTNLTHFTNICPQLRIGIKVGHTPMVLSAAVAEIAVLLMLSAARRAHEGRMKLEQ